jgi:hypothetical protein
MHSCRCIVSFVLICVFVFYFMNRNCSKFKYEFELKEFNFEKRTWINENPFSYLQWPWALTQFGPQAYPAGLLSHFTFRPGPVHWPAAQYGLAASSSLSPSRTRLPRGGMTKQEFSSPRKNPPNPNGSPVQTPIWDRFGVVFLLLRIREQDPDK